MAGHRPVLVKINAYVDEGIAPLVTTLALFRTLRTIESCQGGANESVARVWFVCGEDGRETTVDFAVWLGKRIERLDLDCGDVELQVRWANNCFPRRPTASVQVLASPAHIEKVANALKTIAQEWNGLCPRG